MNTLTVCLLALAAAVTAVPYTDRYDNINVDEVMGNPRMLKGYMMCVLDQGRCSNEGKELKSHIREALEDNCGQCNPKQRENTRKVLIHLINHEPNYWNQLINKYDPQRKFTHRYEKELKEFKG